MDKIIHGELETFTPSLRWNGDTLEQYVEIAWYYEGLLQKRSFVWQPVPRGDF